MSCARSSLPTLIRALALRDSASSAASPAAAGPSTARRAFSASARAPVAPSRAAAAADPLASASSPQTYPFSKNAIVRQVGLIAPEGITPAPTVKSPMRGTMARLTSELRTQYDPTGRISQMFSRRSPARIPPGSVLIVETWTSAARTGFSTFSGVLVAVRRRGVSSAFVLRTLVQKLGVEVRFSMYSPLLKDIKVLSRADAGKDDKTGRLRRTRRAKLYYLRNDDRKIAGISRVVAQMRQREERERQEAANKRGGRK